MKQPWGAIFDWDGVVIDSSRHHEESWERLASEIGKTLPRGHFKLGFGRKNETIIPELLAWTTEPEEIQRLSNRKEALYREVVREIGIAPLPGVHEFLTALREAEIPTCIGSSTHLKNIEMILEETGLGDLFGGIVTAEDVTAGKPDPEVFLKAAEKIQCDPKRCVVFEDAFVGIEAAKRAGMKVVALATTHPIEELQGADLAIAALSGELVTEIREWF